MKSKPNKTARLYQRAEEFSRLAEHSIDPNIEARYRSVALGCIKLAECEEELELQRAAQQDH
jgi:hypothetical protein